jgi:hypothetical protein
MKHIGTSVDKFFNVSSLPPLSLSSINPLLHQHSMANDHVASPAWRIGVHGIVQNHVKIIGAVHVSAGSWMPIMQLTGYVL